MLVTHKSNQANRRNAILAAGAVAFLPLLLAFVWLPAFVFLLLCPIVYWAIRRKVANRLMVMQQPFPEDWEEILDSHIAFFRALKAEEKERFRQIVKVFLSEVRITGIGTAIDDTIRVLVAASAAIPILGFDDWEYHRLGEVLVYPESFGEDYQATRRDDAHTIGMVGLRQLRGVMILSKPYLLEGFKSRSSNENVGIHEFAHLVELEESENGLPPEVPWQAVKHWVEYVAKELAHSSGNRASVRGYAYTNEHEYFAVVSEYFFKSPEILKKKDPELYEMLRTVFHQDPASLFKPNFSKRVEYSRMAACPCKSGKKYEDCCLRTIRNPDL